MHVTSLFVVLLAFLSSAAAAGSARIALPVAAGTVSEAEFWPGEDEKPALLILHGFLQTHHFSTVRRLAESLADEGFTVLTPSLSLGLNRRRQSLACEAVHTHSLASDIDELRVWTQWLVDRTGKSPVVIGHSTGGVHLAALIDTYRDLRIARAVLISLAYFGEEQSTERLIAMRDRAVRDIQSGEERVRAYSLSFCGEYVTDATNLLSYLEWDRSRVETAVRDAFVPVAIIYGDKDDRVDRNWLETLASLGVTVRSVAGANHFFDLSHEFDLFDEVLAVLEEARHG